MSKISIYFNSRASRSQEEFVEALGKMLFRHQAQIKSPDGMAALFAELEKDIAQKVDCIFAIGGDGTVNAILQKIAYTPVKLMIIPAGAANDLARQVGMDTALKKVMQVFNRKTCSRVDLIQVNEKLMATNGGLGAAATVASKINLYRQSSLGFLNLMKNAGANIYPLVFTKEMALSKLKTWRVKIESPDFPEEDNEFQTSIALINNQSELGGKFLVAPGTRNDDGKFNVTIFKHKSKAALVACAYNLMTGRYPHKDKDLISFETDRLDISNLDCEPMPFLGDGETLDESVSFKIESRPGALEVFTYLDDLDYTSSHDLEKITLL